MPLAQRRPYNSGKAAAPNRSPIDAETIRRAEDAVLCLQDDYRDWVRGDIAALHDWLAKAQSAPETREQCFAKMRAIAHDMRGQGSTFGYPLMTRIARSFSISIKSAAEEDGMASHLRAHIDAMAAVIENEVTDPRTAPGVEIIRSLEIAIGRSVD